MVSRCTGSATEGNGLPERKLNATAVADGELCGAIILLWVRSQVRQLIAYCISSTSVRSLRIAAYSPVGAPTRPPTHRHEPRRPRIGTAHRGGVRARAGAQRLVRISASIRTLPYPKQTIKSAILTCASTLRETQQLTSEICDFLEQAYGALADYVADDLERIMAEYREALAAVADVQAARDKVQTPAWQCVAETSRLAGEIAKSIADDTAALRLEFRASA